MRRLSPSYVTPTARTRQLDQAFRCLRRIRAGRPYQYHRRQGNRHRTMAVGTRHHRHRTTAVGTRHHRTLMTAAGTHHGMARNSDAERQNGLSVVEMIRG